MPKGAITFRYNHFTVEFFFNVQLKVIANSVQIFTLNDCSSHYMLLLNLIIIDSGFNKFL